MCVYVSLEYKDRSFLYNLNSEKKKKIEVEDQREKEVLLNKKAFLCSGG